MSESSDMDLLRIYGRQGSEAAFARVVERQVALVYSAALRHVGVAAQAEEITQAVFIILARKAACLRPDTVLEGWLHETTRLTALSFLRGERRRQFREQEAYMQSTIQETGDDPAWKQLGPLLDEGLSRLGRQDRDAVILRFFKDKSMREVAAALTINEAAAQRRILRAVEKLRKFFARRGVTLTAAAIAGTISVNSVSAAPAGLAQTVTVVAVAKGAAAAISTAGLVKGTLKTLAWMKYKPLIITGAITAITSGALVTAVLREQPPGSKAPVTTPVEAAREVMTDSAFISLDSPPGGLLVQSNGKIIVAASLFGNFIDPQSGSLGYFERGALRLNADGSLDRSFSCQAQFTGSDSSRAHVDLLPEGKLLLSGLFDSVDGQPRPGYARLLSDGRVDESFVPTTGTTQSNAPALGRTYLPGGTYPAAALSDGTVAVMTADPLTVYRLDAAGKLIQSATNVSALFPPHAGLVFTLKNEGFWGNWQGQESIDEPIDWNRVTPAKRRPLVHPLGQLPFEDCAEQPSATDAAQVLKALFAEVPLELCRVAMPLPDGGTILGIQDRFINGSLVAPGHLMRFDKDWRPDFSFTNQYEFDRRGGMTIRRLKDGKFLVAGGFVKMNGADFPGLVRLNQNGDIDPGFHCEVTGANYGRLVMDVAVQADGRIVICGAFTAVNGIKQQHLARLNPDGSLDDTFKNPFISIEELETHRRFPVYQLAAKSAPAAAATVAPPAGVPPMETILITSMNFQNGVAMIQFTGSPGQTYILQAKDSLTSAEWTNVSTNQSNAAGMGTFRDDGAKQFPTRFYRIASRQ